MNIGRFAPSPSGRMHLGNALSAMLSWLSAKSKGGEVVLRIEDLDPARSREEYAQGIMSDFLWLGLKWDRQSENQSRRSQVYFEAIDILREKGLVYPCYCSRGELHAASAPHASDGRVIYGGTCRNLSEEERKSKNKVPSHRLIMPDREVSFVDGLQGEYSLNLQKEMGDIIVCRADGVAAYQLAVVVDDAATGVTEVVRGRDLLSSTPAQCYLYELLGLKQPEFYHVPMLLAPDGRRLSKRDKDMDFSCLRANYTSEEILGLLSYLCGLIPKWEKVSLEELSAEFSWEKVSRQDIIVDAEKILGQNVP